MVTYGVPLAQMEVLSRLGRLSAESVTDLVTVIHEPCGQPIGRLAAPRRPRWMHGPVLISREPAGKGDDVAAVTMEFVQLVRGLSVPGRIDLWCDHCGFRGSVSTRELKSVAKRATDGPIPSIRTAGSRR